MLVPAALISPKRTPYTHIHTRICAYMEFVISSRKLAWKLLIIELTVVPNGFR